VGVVCQPSTFSSLEIGYIYENNQAWPVQEVELPLWAHGEGGDQPLDFGFRFKANNKWFNVQASSIP